jgi:hypothetical protein
MFIFANSAFAYGAANMDDFSTYKSKYRILYGIILIVGGGFLAYDGFRNVDIDISKPGYEITAKSRWYTNSQNQFVFASEGTIQNTGNVTLKQIAFDVRYKSENWRSRYYYPDQGMQYIKGISDTPTGLPVRFNETSDILYTSNPNQIDNWKNTSDGYFSSEAGGNPPYPYNDKGNWHTDAVEIINVSYSYDKKYKTEMNNVYEGVAGVLLAGAGIYLLVDYLVGLKKFDYYMKQNNMNVYVANNYEEFKLMVQKRI